MRLLDSTPEPAFDRLTRLAATVLGSPAAALILEDQGRQLVKSSFGSPEWLASERDRAYSESTVRRVIGTRLPLALDDSRVLGVPVIVREQAIGALCVFEAEPRAWTPREIGLLSDVAETAIAVIELKVAVRVAEEQRAVLDAAVESMADGVLALDGSQTFLIANAAARRMFPQGGVEPGMRTRDDWANLYRCHLPDGAPLKSSDGALARGLRGKSTDGLEFTVTSPWAPAVRWLEANGRSVQGAGGQILAAVAVYRDVTEKKQRLDRFTALAGNIPEAAVALFDRDLRCLALDGGIARAEGVDASAAIGRTMRELAGCTPDDPAFHPVDELYRRALAGASGSLDFTHKERVLTLHVAPVRDATGVISAGIVLAADTTERKNLEESLRSARQAAEDALAQVKTLKGLLPICAWCGKIRTEQGGWRGLQEYITEHTDAKITHGLCESCEVTHFRT